MMAGFRMVGLSISVRKRSVRFYVRARGEVEKGGGGGGKLRPGLVWAGKRDGWPQGAAGRSAGRPDPAVDAGGGTQTAGGAGSAPGAGTRGPDAGRLDRGHGADAPEAAVPHRVQLGA